MKWFSSAALVAVVVAATVGPVRADETEAKAVLDKAIKALGGEEKLAKAGTYTYTSKSTINFGGNENEFEGKVTIQGLDHYRNEFSNDQFKGTIVLAGDKGWRKFGDNTMDMDEENIAREKRNVYLQVVPGLLVPLKGKGFKIDSAADGKVDGKPAAAIKATGPDGKNFTLYFDKESGLPVKSVATVVGFQGEDFEQESTFADYKEFGGVKKATKMEAKRNGEPFIKSTITDFKILDKADADTFTEPK